LRKGGGCEHGKYMGPGEKEGKAQYSVIGLGPNSEEGNRAEDVKKKHGCLWR